MILPIYPKLKISAELAAGISTGNASLVSASRTRLAICEGDPRVIEATILQEHGIRIVAEAGDGGLFIRFGRFSHHSFATIHRVLRGAFKVMSAMREDGETVILIPNAK